MRSTIGRNFSLTIFGESHGPAVGFVLDGLPAGITLDLDRIRGELDKRKPTGKISTQRHEADEFRFISGYYEGHTTGTPLTPSAMASRARGILPTCTTASAWGWACCTSLRTRH